MSALDQRDQKRARYRRNLKRALAVAAAIHVVLFAVIPAYRATPARAERDWIRMVDARAWRGRDPWPASAAPTGSHGDATQPVAVDPGPVRMEAATAVETAPAQDAAATPGPGSGSGTGSGGSGGYDEAPPVFYAYDTAPKVLRRVEPIYPIEARDQGLEGTVVLHVNLDARGRIQRAWVARASAAETLIRAAMDAIYQFEFEPGRQKDVPVPCTVAIPFEFHLNRVPDDVGKE
jgi:TonB family protein